MYFLHLESVTKEHKGIDIISFEEFLNWEVMTGHIVNATTGKPVFPPAGNHTNFWNSMPHYEAEKLNRWTQTISYISTWNGLSECRAGFTANPNDPEGEVCHKVIAQNVMSVPMNDQFEMFLNKPIMVDTSPLDRLMEAMADHNVLCIYDHELQKEKVFHVTSGDTNALWLLLQFYAFLFFEKRQQDMWMKRFVRDHLHYVNEIQCAAA